MPRKRVAAAASLGAIAVTCLTVVAADDPQHQIHYRTLDTSDHTGVIEGRVIDAITKRHIAGATVTATQLPPGADNHEYLHHYSNQLEVVTDDAGAFRFHELPAGAIELTASAPGWLDGSPGQRAWDSAGHWIPIAEKQHVRGIDIGLWREPIVSGRVLDESGAGVANIDVALIPADRSMAIDEPIARTDTDDRGHFVIGVAPGTYAVRALDDPGSLYSNTPRRRTAGGQVLTYRTTFHPGAHALGDASPVRVEPADVQTGIDITLTPVPAFTVSGVVSGLANPSRLLVFLRTPVSPSEDSNDYDHIATTDSAGRFVLSRVAAGPYDVTVQHVPVRRSEDPPGATGPTLWARQRVAVVDRDVTVALPLARAATISGSLRFEGMEARPTMSDLQKWRLSVRRAGTNAEVVQAEFVDGPRFLTTGIPPGRYSMSGYGPGGWSLSAILIAGVNVLDQPVEVGQYDIEDATVIFTDQRLKVTGSINTDPPSHFMRVWITILPADRTLWNAVAAGPGTHRRVRHLRTGVSGGFATPLPAGAYLVVATDSRVGPLRSVDACARLAAFATAVTVSETQQAVPVLRVQRVVR